MHRLVRRLSSSAAQGQFRVTSEGSLRRIAIDHPARRNALTLDMYRQLPRIAADANGGRVALLEGVGEHFSAGSDISEFATLRADSYQAEEWDAVEIKAAESLRDLDIPLVALVRGNCYGSALNLMLMADVRVAADDATFCVPPAKLGLGYPRHLLEPLVDTVGRSAASELILTARVINAAEAKQLGLVHRVVAANEAAAAAEAAAAEIASLAPLVQRAAKAMMRGRRGKDGRFMADARYQECFDSRDYQEGLKAFAEGRDPVFNGS